jgi:hypothetical protein
LKQRLSSVLPSAVPSKLALSSKLHCCCGLVVLAHGWNATTLPAACGVPASRHMPSDVSVCVLASTRLRFDRYANFCAMLPAVHGRSATLVPAAGSPEPASRHRSVLVAVL